MLDDEAMDAIARALAEAQVGAGRSRHRRVRVRHPALTVAVVTGLGDFIAAEAAQRSGLEVVRLAERHRRCGANGAGRGGRLAPGRAPLTPV